MFLDKRKSNHKQDYCFKEYRQVITDDMIKFRNSVSLVKRNELFILLKTHRECFTLKIEKIRCINVVKSEIVDNNIPVRCRPYNTTKEDRQPVSRIVNNLKVLV